MSNKEIRTELKKLVNQIETLAQQVGQKLEKDEVVVDTANELVSSTVAFTFHLGHLYGFDKATAKPAVKAARAVKPASFKSPRYHNTRDSKGRFVSSLTARP
jgi:hypothetical protein